MEYLISSDIGEVGTQGSCGNVCTGRCENLCTGKCEFFCIADCNIFCGFVCSKLNVPIG